LCWHCIIKTSHICVNNGLLLLQKYVRNIVFAKYVYVTIATMIYSIWFVLFVILLFIIHLSWFIFFYLCWFMLHYIILNKNTYLFLAHLDQRTSVPGVVITLRSSSSSASVDLSHLHRYLWNHWNKWDHVNWIVLILFVSFYFGNAKDCKVTYPFLEAEIIYI